MKTLLFGLALLCALHAAVAAPPSGTPLIVPPNGNGGNGGNRGDVGNSNLGRGSPVAEAEPVPARGGVGGALKGGVGAVGDARQAAGAPVVQTPVVQAPLVQTPVQTPSDPATPPDVTADTPVAPLMPVAQALVVPKAPTVAQPALPKAPGITWGVEPAAQTQSRIDMPAYETGQVIVVWPQEPSGVSLSSMAQAVGAVLRTQTVLGALALQVGVLQLQDEAAARDAVKALSEAYPHVTIDLHARGYAQQMADAAKAAGSARHYAQALMGLAPSSALVSARVGIIDTGLQAVAAQRILAAGSVTEKRFFSPLDRPASPEHGTAVAAVVAGRSIGTGEGQGFAALAPGVALFQASVMRNDKGFATSNTLSLALALNWLTDQKVDVINMSLASKGDKVFAFVIDRVLASGTPVVAAVGPGAAAPDLIYPAAYPGVVAVASVDAAKQPDSHGARGPYVALSAPGVEVWLPVAAGASTGASTGAYYTGSSFAAPWVSAAMARLKASMGAAFSPAKALSRLCADAIPWATPAPTGAGCGVLNLRGAQ